MPESSDTSENKLSIADLTSKASEEEKANESSRAIELYNQVLKTDPLQVHAYDRLMILYRQEKNYKKELSVINSGIKTFQRFFKEQKGKPSKKISELSEKLNNAFHLVDKKGNSLYMPEPVAGWEKRKKTVEKKLEKEVKKKK